MDVINAELNYTSIGKTVDVDLDNYYTKEETDALIPDITGFALKTEIPDVSKLALKTEIPDTSGFALKTEIPDTTGFATEEYVNNAVSNVDVDLSNYYTKNEVNELIPDTTGFALKTEIPDVSGFALKSEIPSTSGLATQKYVDDAIANINIPKTDLTNYYTKEEIDSKFSAIPTYPDGNEVAY